MSSHPLSLRTLAAMSLVASAGLGGLHVRTARAADWTVAAADNSFGADRQDLGYTVNPGGRIQDGIVVGNPGTSPLRVAVSAADAHTDSSGELALRGRRGVGAWVHPATAGITVAPGTSATVPFTLAPVKEAAPGDYAGGILVASGGEQVSLPIRLRIGGALKPSLAVEDVHVDTSEVTYTVHNTGNATLAARSTLKVSGPFGRFPAKTGGIADTPSLLPGETWTVAAPVRDVTPALRTTATVTLTPLLTDAAGSTAPLPAVKTSGHAWTIPWLLVLAVVVVIVLVVAGVRLRPRRRAHALSSS